MNKWSLFAIGTLLTACQQASMQQIVSNASSGSKELSPPSSSSPSTTVPSVAEASISEGRVGVKNFHQLLRSMAVVTGVPPNESNVASTFTLVKPQLPQTNDIGAFQASHQAAIVKLAAQFCDRVFETADLRSQIFPDTNFGAVPALVFTAEAKPQFAAKILDRIWGEAPEGGESDRAAMVSHMVDLTDQLLTGAPASATGTKGIFKGLCTAALSSAPFILL